MDTSSSSPNSGDQAEKAGSRSLVKRIMAIVRPNPSTALATPSVSPQPLTKEERAAERRRLAERKVAKGFVKKIVTLGIVGIPLMYVAFTLLYFGCIWNPPTMFRKLPCAIVYPGTDAFAGGIATTLSEAKNEETGEPWFDWTLVLEDEPDVEKWKREVNDMKYWVAIVFRKGFTMESIIKPVGYGTTPTDREVLFIYDEGRQQTTFTTIKRVFSEMFTTASIEMSLHLLAGDYAGAGLGVPDLDVANHEVLQNPVVKKEVNLHPVKRNGAAFAAYMGYIVLWICSLFSVNLLRTCTLFIEEHYPKAKLFLVRIGLGFVYSLILACLYVIVLACLSGHQFEKGWFALLLLTLLAGCTFMSIIGTITRLMDMPGLLVCTLVLILQVASCDGIFAIDAMVGFYQIGKGLPMYHAVHAARYLMFGSANDLGLNLGVLFIYLVASFLGYIALNYKSIQAKPLHPSRKAIQRRLLKEEEKEEGMIEMSDTKKVETVDTTTTATTSSDDVQVPIPEDESEVHDLEEPTYAQASHVLMSAMVDSTVTNIIEPPAQE